MANIDILRSPSGIASLEMQTRESLVKHNLFDRSTDRALLERDIKFLPAAYSFIELASWRDLIDQNLSAGMEIVLTDVDERKNQVLIGILQSAAEVNTSVYLNSLGIPSEAVNFVTVGHATATRTVVPTPPRSSMLTDRVRPIAGGLGIQNNGCTLGVPVWHSQQQGGGDPDPAIHPWGFLTAAHCTQYVDHVEPRDMYQPVFLQTNDLIGREYREAPYYDCGLGIPCLDADAALIDISDDLGLQKTVGDIYLTTALGTQASLTIGTTLEITLDRNPVVGDTLQKVGSKSGWTQGVVTNTCANRTVGGIWHKNPWGNPSGTDVKGNVRMQCHALSTLPVMVGDSGSAVFRNRGGNRGDLLGILSFCTGCTGSFATSTGGFATWNNIQATLGTDVRTRLE